MKLTHQMKLTHHMKNRNKAAASDKLKNSYVFPAIFTFEEKGISIEFPDLPGCLPCGKTQEEALDNAREALGLHIYGMEEDGEEIPKASSVGDLSMDMDKNSAVVLVDVFMPTVREKVKKTVVKKTLTIPGWLNTEAEKNNINFSQTLQEALIKQLGISR